MSFSKYTCACVTYTPMTQLLFLDNRMKSFISASIYIYTSSAPFPYWFMSRYLGVRTVNKSKRDTSLKTLPNLRLKLLHFWKSAEEDAAQREASSCSHSAARGKLRPWCSVGDDRASNKCRSPDKAVERLRGLRKEWSLTKNHKRRFSKRDKSADTRAGVPGLESLIS